MYKIFLISIFVFFVKFGFGQITVALEQPCAGGTGSITLTASFDGAYLVYITGPSTNISDNFTSGSYVINDLFPGTYSVRVDRILGFYLNNIYNNPSLVLSTDNSTPPVFQNPQANISQFASSTDCGAIINYPLPSVTDNCSPRTGTITNYSYLGSRNGHTYYLSDNALNVTTATTYANNLGGHLATINDQGENDWINAKVDEVWIGYNDVASEGNFVWITGETSTYTLWNGGEPNNYNGEDHVVMYSNGRWNDLNGAAARRYVVEFEPIAVVQTAGLASGSVFPIGTTLNTFTATDGSGNTSTHSFNITIIDNTSPAVTQLKANYYTGTNFDTFRETLNVTNLDYNWGSGPPPSNLVGSDNFSIRFNGNIKAPQSGTYTFYTDSDDGVRLWVSGTKIIDNWTNHAATLNTGTITLTANQSVPIRLDYYEAGGNSSIRLRWSGPGITTQVVTNSTGATCNDVTIDVSGTGSGSIAVADVDPGYEDACGIATRTLSQTNFTCSDVGSNAVTLTITDVNGNSNSCTVNVEVTGKPNAGLTVVGSTACKGETANIIVQNSESGVDYSLYFGSVQIGSIVNGTGSNITLPISTASMSIGNNSVTVKAIKGSCEQFLSSNATIVVNKVPVPSGVYHE